jgi:hypothetical protein
LKPARLTHALGRDVADVDVCGDAAHAEIEGVLGEHPGDPYGAPAAAGVRQDPEPISDDRALGVEVVQDAATDDIAGRGVERGYRRHAAAARRRRRAPLRQRNHARRPLAWAAPPALPHSADQTNPQALLDRGAGHRLLPEEITAKTLQALLTEPEYRQAARGLAAEIAAMPAPAEVVSDLERPRSP